MDRTVGAELDFTARGDSRVELQIAVARPRGLQVDESLVATVDGAEVPMVELSTAHGGRLHQLDVPDGPCSIRYRARVSGVPDLPGVDQLDLSLHRRPSRYVPSDTLLGFASAEFGDLAGSDLLRAVTRWVSTRFEYVPGSSGPSDGAAETLLSGQGVCRDYAHVVIALLRARNVPARLTAVYAPGCDPMDFHAVVEAYVEDAWYVADATGLAPRQSLLRIATGRDAADTAFLSTITGDILLERSEVTAITDGDLPRDDPEDLVALG